jgi:hypothetical protein
MRANLHSFDQDYFNTPNAEYAWMALIVKKTVVEITD